MSRNIALSIRAPRTNGRLALASPRCTDADHIASIAWRSPSGGVFRLRKLNRHGELNTFDDLADTIAGAGLMPEDGEMGFVCSDGKFMTREEAAEHAHDTGQIKSYTPGAALDPEDLWSEEC